MITPADVLSIMQGAWSYLTATHPVLVTLLLGGTMLWLIMRHH